MLQRSTSLQSCLIDSHHSSFFSPINDSQGFLPSTCPDMYSKSGSLVFFACGPPQQAILGFIFFPISTNVFLDSTHSKRPPYHCLWFQIHRLSHCLIALKLASVTDDHFHLRLTTFRLELSINIYEILLASPPLCSPLVYPSNHFGFLSLCLLSFMSPYTLLARHRSPSLWPPSCLLSSSCAPRHIF